MTDPASPPETTPAPTRVSATTVTGREASQGRKGWGVSRILAISLALIVLGFAVIYALHAPGLSTNHGAGGQSGIVNHTEADSFHAPEPAPKPAPGGASDGRGTPGQN